MEYLSTHDQGLRRSFCQTVLKGLAPDGGLFFPSVIPKINNNLTGNGKLSLANLGEQILFPFMGDIVSREALHELLDEALNFPVPLIEVEKNIYALELFHGPTLAFKDVGARCFGRLLSQCRPDSERITVLTATSGDTGGAVANGLYGVDGVDVVVFYPKGKVAKLQELQFASLGENITALAVDGDFDDCQRLVKECFADAELREFLNLTTANSINTARWLPQVIYYFWLYRRLGESAVISVPSGNFGNITAGLLARAMGMPATRIIAACNANDAVTRYLSTGQYHPRPTIHTIANAMDVGNPSNFERLQMLFHHSADAAARGLVAYNYDDNDIYRAIKTCYSSNGYLLDPHGACGYLALKEDLGPGEKGVFLATAHPAKFAAVYADLGMDEPKHPVLEALRGRKVLSVDVGKQIKDVKLFLSMHPGR